MQQLLKILEQYDRISREFLEKRYDNQIIRKLLNEGFLAPDPSNDKYFLVVKKTSPKKINIERTIRDLLKDKCYTIDELVETIGIDKNVVIDVLEKLVLKGKVKRRGKKYCRGSTRITRRRGSGKIIEIEVEV